jgi:hypothetical protein
MLLELRARYALCIQVRSNTHYKFLVNKCIFHIVRFLKNVFLFLSFELLLIGQTCI